MRYVHHRANERRAVPHEGDDRHHDFGRHKVEEEKEEVPERRRAEQLFFGDGTRGATTNDGLRDLYEDSQQQQKRRGTPGELTAATSF